MDNIAMGVAGNIAPPLVEILMPPNRNRDITSPTGQPTAGYVIPSPGYVVPTPAYATPTPGYVTPSPGYVTPTPAYVMPSAGYVTPTPGYVTPIDYTIHPTFRETTPTFMPPNGDSAILHTGKVIPTVGDILQQGGVAPRIVQSQMPIASKAQGVVKPGLSHGLVQSGGITPAMKPVSTSMPGIVQPYVAPYGTPGLILYM